MTLWVESDPRGKHESRWKAEKPHSQQGATLPDDTVASVGCKDDDGGNRRFQGPVQVGEALDVQHVDLINKEYTWNQLSDALINVLIHHLVNFPSKFV